MFLVKRAKVKFLILGLNKGVLRLKWDWAFFKIKVISRIKFRRFFEIKIVYFSRSRPVHFLKVEVRFLRPLPIPSQRSISRYFLRSRFWGYRWHFQGKGELFKIVVGLIKIELLAIARPLFIFVVRFLNHGSTFWRSWWVFYFFATPLFINHDDFLGLR